MGTALGVQLLGPLAVSREGADVALPPSRKTRALLAYLLLTGRSHTRDRLCDLLWDVADDPRGALRWSLSKLRGVVDDGEHKAVVADRSTIAIDASGLDVDALRVDRASIAGWDAARTEELVELAALFRGELMEDLDLEDFHEFNLWAAAERERFRGMHLDLLRTLVDRLASDPETALPHARAWSRLDPLDEGARARLVRLLGATGRRDEAQAQVDTGRALARDRGGSSGEALRDAWREVSGTHVARAQVAPTTAPFGERPLIGRKAELASVVAELDQALGTGRARVALLTGEPGVGKSRLLSALLDAARTRGTAVLHGRAHEVEHRPYGPWVDALRSQPLLQQPRWRERLGPMLGDDDEREGGRERLFAAVANLADELAGSQGVVIALDDVHWCDEASTSLVHYVARTLSARPVLVVLLARAGELAAHDAAQRCLAGLRRDLPLATMSLGPLDRAATERLVADVDAGADGAAIHAESAGNPLFAIELARAGPDAQGMGGVAALVRDRLLSLPDGALDLLRWAAVLGSTCDTTRLGAVASQGADDTLTHLGTLENHALLVSEDDGRRTSFAHDVVRSTVYDDLTPAQRRLMHSRVADVLDSADSRDPEVAVALARHADLAGRSALAARAFVTAGRHALRMFANAEAEALAERGLECTQTMSDPERVERAVELVQIALAARQPDDADQTLALLDDLARRAIDHGSQDHARAAFEMQSYVRYDQGRWNEAMRDSLRAERVSRGDEPHVQVRALGEAAKCLALLERDLGKADAMAHEAQALSQTTGDAPPAVPLALGMLAAWRGEAEEAVDMLDQARVVSDLAGDRLSAFQALEQRVMLELHLGNHVQAQAHAHDLTSIGERIREGSEEPFARLLGLLARAHQGDTEALTAMDEPLERLRVLDAKFRRAFALNRAAELDLVADDPERARARAEVALDLARVLRRRSEEVTARVVLARAAAALDDPDAVEAQRAALQDPELRQTSAWCRARVHALRKDMGWDE